MLYVATTKSSQRYCKPTAVGTTTVLLVYGRRFFLCINNIIIIIRSFFPINLINCTIYLPKGRELKKMKTYNYKIRDKK